MKHRRSVHIVPLAIMALMIAAAFSFAQDSPEPINTAPQSVDAEADRALREMSEFLQKGESFTLHIDTTYDAVRSSGQKIQYSMSSNAAVKRPGSLRVNMTGDEHSARVYCDGETFVLYDTVENTYAKIAVPNELGAALDLVWDEFDINVPVADILFPDPYAILIENVQTGQHVGKHLVQGVVCDHLAFTQEFVDWQIWIEDGIARLPRKLLITYKDEPGQPQYSAVLTEWKLRPIMSDHIFRFVPPAGADEIEFLPVYEAFTTETDGGEE